jgi:hypothetical protein
MVNLGSTSGLTTLLAIAAAAALAVAPEAASLTPEDTPPKDSPAAGPTSPVDQSNIEFQSLGV